MDGGTCRKWIKGRGKVEVRKEKEGEGKGKEGKGGGKVTVENMEEREGGSWSNRR